METCNLSKVSEDDDCNNIQKVEEQIESKMLSADKEKLVQELIDMGFSKSAVVQIVENARDVPKNMIIEQLLSSNYRPENLPVLDDDDDPMWEDITVTNKMVIVINKGLNMGIGKIASQVIQYNSTIRILNNDANNTKIKCKVTLFKFSRLHMLL
ncbi:Hypothetical protein CINCED_3A000009 [Cinara cedri]|uniref:UBA domain-containing protein n=1 Tax=Cinara cedri TaxID=506608 RepID=A0A5E4NL29_9HEMI|nr:Hypothetical protein CINCED_3A000009 [Cinara cedri]